MDVLLSGCFDACVPASKGRRTIRTKTAERNLKPVIMVPSRALNLAVQTAL
jgi:hypothetical protein